MILLELCQIKKYEITGTLLDQEMQELRCMNKNYITGTVL